MVIFFDFDFAQQRGVCVQKAQTIFGGTIAKTARQGGLKCRHVYLLFVFGYRVNV